jgi:hypothetical protein
MTLEKILITHRDKQYSLTVEVMPDEDETIFRATPDQAEPLLEGIPAGYIEFDEKGNRQYEAGDEEVSSEEEKEIETAIWRGIKEQVLSEHPEYRRSPQE